MTADKVTRVPSGTGVVLLDYDQAATTRRCLRSIAAGHPPDEIVLVENGGPPVSMESEPELGELNLRVLPLEHNSGAALGRNLGLDYLVRNSPVERYVLLDNDTTVPPDFFERVAAMELGELEIAAPLILSMESGEVIYAGGRFDRYRHPSVIPEWPDGATEPQEVEWAPTVALVFDRRTWLHVGGFDEGYRFSWEDIEWCERAVKLGARVRVRPELSVMHDAHQSSGGPFSPERLYLWARNGTVFIFENAGWPARGNWFRVEMGRVLHELARGWRRPALARVRGAVRGVLEVRRRARARRPAP